MTYPHRKDERGQCLACRREREAALLHESDAAFCTRCGHVHAPRRACVVEGRVSA